MAQLAGRLLESGHADGNGVPLTADSRSHVAVRRLPSDAHNALLPRDAFHLSGGRPVTHKIYRDAAHPARLVLPFTKRQAHGA